MKFYVKLRVLCLLLILLCAQPSLYTWPSSAAALADIPVSTETREGRLAVFDDVWRTVRDRYYDPSFNGLDWEAEREKFRPLAAEAKTRAEFYRVLKRMLGALRDSHTRVYAPDEKFDWQRPRVVTTGISVREVAGLPVVLAVERDSDAERAGVRVGDIITSVDDEPALKLFAKRLRESPQASTAQASRARAMASLLAGPAGTSVKVGWRGQDNRERTALLNRQWRDRTARLQIEKAGEDFFLVRFDSFTRTVAIEFMRALEDRLRGARGLILDLRNNGGGDAEAMTDMLSSFLPPRTALGRFTDRTGRVQIEPRTRRAMLVAPLEIARYTGALIIITSERTASAAEIFVASVKQARRATVIGTGTCGCVLAIRRRHALPDGGEMDISEMDYRTSLGVRLEGAGVAPDEVVMQDLSDIRARRDRPVMRALERLRSESGE